MSMPPPVERVSTLELFFDLVFVFTITQLTLVLVDAPTWTGLGQVLLVLTIVWWMYGGYAWLTNAVPPDRPSRRLLLVAAMGAYLVLALTIPAAFHGSGLAFGLAYSAIVLVHAGLFSRSVSVSVTQAVVGIAPLNTVAAIVILVGGAVGGATQYVLWTVAVALEWIVTRVIDRNEGFEISPSHFVERHGLVVIVALGEAVVAVGLGAAGRPVDVALVLVAVLGLLLNAALWWTYFGGDDERAERALTETTPRRRPRMAVNGFGAWHIGILLGIILVAAGLEPAIEEAYHPLLTARALMLGGGVAVFLASDVGFRHVMGIGSARPRLVVAVLAVATVPVGTQIAAVAQIGVLVALLAAMIAVEALPSAGER